MRQRSFARMWRETHRERGEDEEMPTGPMADWCTRIQGIRDQAAITDARRAIEDLKRARSD